MHWSDIRRDYPRHWLLIEALQAHSDGGHRIVDDAVVVAVYDDSQSALSAYAKLHRETPQRELYVFHTNRQELDILERNWFGVRASI